jgi:hypothetical protein
MNVPINEHSFYNLWFGLQVDGMCI